MITCFLCNRQWPKSQARHAEGSFWACGEPRHCYEYNGSTAAQKILKESRRQLYLTDPGAYRAETAARRL